MANQEQVASGIRQGSEWITSLTIAVGVAANTALPLYMFVCLKWLPLGADRDPSQWAAVLSFGLENYDQYAAKIVQYGLGATAVGLTLRAALAAGPWSVAKLTGACGVVVSALGLAIAGYDLFQLRVGGEFADRILQVPYDGPLKALGPAARAAVLQSVDTLMIAVTGALGFTKGGSER